MGLDEECWIFCTPPYSLRCPIRIMSVGMIITTLDQFLDKNTANEDRSPGKEEIEFLDKINKDLMKELANAPGALAIINAYERAIIRTMDIHYSMLREIPKKTDDELNCVFLAVKTMEIVPFKPICARDMETMVTLLGSSAYVDAVRAIIKKAKVQVGMEELTVA